MKTNIKNFIARFLNKKLNKAVKVISKRLTTK